MGRLYRRKFEKNKSIFEATGEKIGYILCQKLEPVAKMKYGLANISFCGCETIAVYNALVAMDKKVYYPELLKQFHELHMERFFGIFGTRPGKIAKYFDKYNIPYTKIKNEEEFVTKSKDAEHMILCYNNGIFKIHTVYIKRIRESYYFYNLYSNVYKPYRLSSPVKFYSYRRFICAYLLDDNG